MSAMNLEADVFLSTEANEILKNKYVLLIGDSGYNYEFSKNQ
jgi:hypothetical protein